MCDVIVDLREAWSQLDTGQCGLGWSVNVSVDDVTTTDCSLRGQLISSCRQRAAPGHIRLRLEARCMTANSRRPAAIERGHAHL